VVGPGKLFNETMHNKMGKEKHRTLGYNQPHSAVSQVFSSGIVSQEETIRERPVTSPSFVDTGRFRNNGGIKKQNSTAEVNF